MDRLVSLLKEARRVLVFTGAGISTGSGIPDFRGPGGVWSRRRPVYFREFMNSEEARIEHWDYKLEGFDAFKNARPNAAHRALVDLERGGKLGALVTQNIDGLHHDAGNAEEKIIELHGTNRKVECVTCGALTEPEPAFEEFRRTRRCPRCPCGGLLKTATVSFGQSMPQDKLMEAFAAAEKADLAIAVGSTLEVEPAASVPLAAWRRGTPYAIVNRGPTAHDEVAHVRLEGDATEILPELLRRSGVTS